MSLRIFDTCCKQQCGLKSILHSQFHGMGTSMYFQGEKYLEKTAQYETGKMIY